MEVWIAGIVIGVALALVWWVFKPSSKAHSATDERPGSGMRLAERGLDALTRGLKVAVDDESLVDRFDFPPFGRGINRAATEVVTGVLDEEDIVAFRYSFALERESKRREFDVTVIPAALPWTGRLRLASLPRERSATPRFADAWRIDEEPDSLAVITPGVQSLLLNDRLKASAVVAQSDAIVLIDTVRPSGSDLDADVALMKEIRAALHAK